MLTQQTAIDKVRKFAQQIRNEGITLRRVVLYGSYSRNEQHKNSDIDVALVADEFKGIYYFDFDLYGKTIIKKQFCNIQPRTYQTGDFNINVDPFVEEILKSGIEII